LALCKLEPWHPFAVSFLNIGSSELGEPLLEEAPLGVL
jgi:hypothetical protein